MLEARLEAASSGYLYSFNGFEDCMYLVPPSVIFWVPGRELVCTSEGEGCSGSNCHPCIQNSNLMEA